VEREGVRKLVVYATKTKISDAKIIPGKFFCAA